jgi:hypothetical protein
MAALSNFQIPVAWNRIEKFQYGSLKSAFRSESWQWLCIAGKT